jgi:hypothetical protein
MVLRDGGDYGHWERKEGRVVKQTTSENTNIARAGREGLEKMGLLRQNLGEHGL